MLKVAIVDDGICEEIFDNEVQISHYHILDGYIVKNKNKEERKITHGTICAFVLLSVESNIEIIDIKAFSNMEASVEDILAAFRFCICQNVSVINMSFGTVNFLDYKKMEDTILQLQKKNIFLVSAFSNSSILSFPAACKMVFGVRRDIWNKLENGQFGFQLQSGFGLENCLVAHYNLKKIKSLSNMMEGNSFAAPIISGWILKILQGNGDATFKYVLSQMMLNEQSKQCRAKRIKRKYNVKKYTVITPVIGIYYSNFELLDVIKKFFLDNAYNIIIITEEGKGDYEIPSNLYLRRREKVSKKFIFTLERNYKADVIILYLNKCRFLVRNLWKCLDIIFEQEEKLAKISNSKKNKDVINVSDAGKYISDYYS